MIKELMYKWFGLDNSCKTCEVLRSELDYVRREKEILLNRLLTPREETIPAPVNDTENMKPLAPSMGRRFIPHAVKQQMMAKEDAKSLELMVKKNKEISELEKEIGVEEKEDASKIS